MISNDKVRVSISLTKDLNQRLDDIIAEAKKQNIPLSKSQLVEVALNNFLRLSMEATQKGEKK